MEGEWWADAAGIASISVKDSGNIDLCIWLPIFD
jgi:hypothetical protein